LLKKKNSELFTRFSTFLSDPRTFNLEKKIEVLTKRVSTELAMAQGQTDVENKILLVADRLALVRENLST
jgi:hypothetical protein